MKDLNIDKDIQLIKDDSLEQQIIEHLNYYNINWEVEKLPLTLPDDEKTKLFGIVHPKHRKVFQVCTKQYVAFQNKDAVELAIQIAHIAHTKIDSIKLIREGEILTIRITGREFDLTDTKVGDTIKEQIIISNSHNGSLKISFGHIVLSCLNGMTRFDKKGSYSIRHTTSMLSRLKDAVRGLKKIITVSSDMRDNYIKMANTPVTQKDVKKALSIMGDVGMDINASDISTKKKNILKDILVGIKREVEIKGLNAWGLMNGITYYTTIEAQKSDSRLYSKMYGEIARREMKIWDYLISI